MIFDKIELLDHDYGTVKKSSKIRKIKFKSISFQNISNLWKNFRISCLEKRLQTKKDKLVSMEISNSDFNNKTRTGESVAERKILRKTTAIARLESKIEVLKTGTDVTDDFISSRAIKLKDNMMKNMRYNCNSAYSVLAENADKIFETETKAPEHKTTVEEVMAETEKEVAANVQQMMEEERNENQPQTEVRETFEAKPVTVTAPSREEIRKTVDEMFAAQAKLRKEQTAATEKVIEQTEEKVVEEVPVVEHTVSHEETKQAVQEEMNTIDVVPTVAEEEISEAVHTALDQIDVTPVITEEVQETVNEELNNIRVTQNESSAAKVNKFINEDGTYRMKREDIPEEFRVTRYKRDENQSTTMVDMIKERACLAQLKAIEDKYAKSATVSNAKTENPPAREEVAREVPIVAPTRETVKTTVKALSDAVDEVETMDDIKKIMASVAELRAQNEEIERQKAATAKSTQELKAEKTQAVQELLDYQASLQAEYAQGSKQVEEQQAEADALASEIQSIRSVIGRR